MFTRGDVARCSLGGPQDFYNEEMLYRLFGVNAELLIDHAWGWEPCTIADIKAYKPAANSCGSGQVLHCATPADQARLIVREMADQLALDLVDKHLMTNQLVLTVGYDRENLTDPTRNAAYHGPVDVYKRQLFFYKKSAKTIDIKPAFNATLGVETNPGKGPVTYG